ncbi:23S rRNA (pseudouridine(1915)-N(3))-methyltransferase RlmH [Edaphobacter sp. 12200R-103]|uniref:23S rRNA (pseudouridine(1915)-N(3))-methyltransferase RlmH n=1 Tax=Edaphobacter sp. 12200R-103 TaxID=2703788 RepID=UPI00138D75D6|nr:23S rRNA (pseudouridine(1915)-N(3))-methyltransferase RlmH [Edaphobacter sp. 12200R-103]QHS52769.1 23S rRNA (pseudouridine(1915)-N(3))-methyltransferase RlmH [Edaphobacter sp. 12200R-103]
MNIYLGAITARGGRSKASAAATLIAEYVDRAARYAPVESIHFPDEDSMFGWLERGKGRTDCFLVLLDSSGRELTSEEIASFLARQRDTGQQRILLAIGPASGWSEASRKRASLMLSFGRITLPHELAAVVLAEQIYRALTITAGHPYHCDH